MMRIKAAMVEAARQPAERTGTALESMSDILDLVIVLGDFYGAAAASAHELSAAPDPDGNLYMADMYRQVINEGVVLPPTLRKCFDLTEGNNRGRIYRVVPEAFRHRRTPDLGKATTGELVALLEHANCWHHTTAARLLYERQDPAAVGPLVKMAAESAEPLGRMHAMYALDGLDKQVLRLEREIAALPQELERARGQVTQLTTEIEDAVNELLNLNWVEVVNSRKGVSFDGSCRIPPLMKPDLPL